LRASARQAGLREPGTGEFLDALKACRQLGIDQSSPVFTELARSTLWKHERDPGPSATPDP
jgi:hypothetical protein